jgi:hypothetical protein
LTSAACIYTTGLSQSANLSGKVLTLNEAPINDFDFYEIQLGNLNP